MENLNEIIVILKKLSQDGKGLLYLDNIIELCNKDYNMDKANVISKLNYRINKEIIKKSKVSNTEEIFKNDDTLSYKDKMFEKAKYKAFKDKLLENIKVDIKTYITELEINKKFPRNYNTILSETHDQKWYETRMKSLETELARKFLIVFVDWIIIYMEL